MTTPVTAPQVQRWEASDADAGQRIDNFLLRRLKGVPRSVIYRILRSGEVRVNSGRVAPAYRLEAGDVVRVPPVRVAAPRPAGTPEPGLARRLEAAVIHEDERLIVVDKPAGLAVHGGSGLSLGVIEALRALRPRERELELVHRLDRDTSGCLMLAKRRSALRLLHELQREGRIEKRYLALLAGRWDRDRADVDAPLRKNVLQGGERMVHVSAEGKAALTRFRVLSRFADSTLVEARLVTGRTHQIRVHAAHLGTPILGDAKYGDADANARYRALGLRRLFLHAVSLTVRWPGDEPALRVSAPLDPALQGILDRLDET
ncbi:MAG: 23S rRNA pseudouridine(955/2504/2580) synthase RluC, partial [Gammaproteobacteria bacterium]|nr:23S rRNA pseudouridine(955/2504/2580) synthase RluC [Gammaproteobacteria bacterium]